MHRASGRVMAMGSAGFAAPAATTDALVAHTLEQSEGGVRAAVQQVRLEVRDDEARNKVRDGMAAHEVAMARGGSE